MLCPHLNCLTYCFVVQIGLQDTVAALLKTDRQHKKSELLGGACTGSMLAIVHSSCVGPREGFKIAAAHWKAIAS